MNQYKLLIVDNPSNVKSIEDCLHDKSCFLQSASSGQEALKIMRNSNIDILISRLELLDINGLALYKAMKDQRPDMHFILIADSSCKMDTSDCHQLKIINRSENMNTISDCVNQAISQIKKNQQLQKKILIVEDTKALLFTQLKMLKKIGFSNIVTAANGNHAIALLMEMTSPPDLIISDWYMPEKTGLELLQWLQQNDTFKTIPFIMATSKKEAMMAIDAGANHFLIKPYDIDTIQKAVEKVLDNN
jgi:DNA-binding NtrC family response regulator